jgi:uncharacterized protein
VFGLAEDGIIPRQRWNFLLDLSVDFDAFDFTHLHRIVLNLSNLNLKDELEASAADIDIADGAGRTPLWWAVWRHEFQKAQLLIDFGADVNSTSVGGWTPLLVALNCGLYEITRLLLQSNADVSNTLTCGAGSITVWAGGEPMQPEQEQALCLQLLSCGISIHGRDIRGRTALHIATLSANSSLVKTELLLKDGAEIDVIDDAEYTPLLNAIYVGRTNLVDLLIRNNARVDVRTWRRATVLHVAIL